MAFAEPLPDSTIPELSGRVGLTVLAWGCAIAGVAVMDAWLGAFRSAWELAGLGAIGFAPMAYWVYRRLRPVRLALLADGRIQWRPPYGPPLLLQRQELRLWSRQKVLSDMVRGSIIAVLVGICGIIVLLVPMPAIRGMQQLAVAAPILALSGITLFEAVHGYLRRWTIESDTPSGWFDFITLSREDVVRLCGRWPRDEDPAAH